MDNINLIFHELAAILAPMIAREVAEQLKASEPKGDDLIFADEAKKMLGGVSDMTLCRWHKNGYLPKRHVGHRVAYLRSDINNLNKKGGNA